MNKLRRKVYMTAGYNTVSMGTGRKEFHPKKPRPGLEDYIREAGRGTLAQAGGALNIDEGVIGNFMAARFNGQGNLAAFIPAIDEDECTACGSCVDMCPVKALKLEDVAKVDLDTCIGCGVCATHCDPKAIKLIRRAQQIAIPDDVKGHVDKL